MSEVEMRVGSNEAAKLPHAEPPREGAAVQRATPDESTPASPTPPPARVAAPAAPPRDPQPAPASRSSHDQQPAPGPRDATAVALLRVAASIEQIGTTLEELLTVVNRVVATFEAGAAVAQAPVPEEPPARAMPRRRAADADEQEPAADEEVDAGEQDAAQPRGRGARDEVPEDVDPGELPDDENSPVTQAILRQIEREGSLL